MYKNTQIYRDILEIPALLDEFDKKFNFNLRNYPSVFLLGRGSSGNATLFAKYLWEMYCGVISNIIHPFSILNAKKRLNFSNSVLFSFSQSGKSSDIVLCTKLIKSMGARVVAITNEENIKENNLAQIADIHILLSNSKEIPVAATKSFILQLWAVMRISKIMGSNFEESLFRKTRNNIEKIINSFGNLYRKYNFNKILRSSIIGIIGRGPFNAISEDSALKFREMAQIHSLGYSAAEFLHGPIGSFTSKDYVILLSQSQKLNQDLVLVEKKLIERKVNYIIVKPFSNNYPFNSIETDVFMKLVALKLADIKGLDPDNPKGLKKVTHTI